MEYRKHPRGNEQIGVMGIGLGVMVSVPENEVEAMITKALDHGINFFDLCCGENTVYAPFGRAVRARREKVYVQMHFGAVYNSQGEYGWSRDLQQIRQTMNWELQTLGFDYIDYGFLHCVDTEEDYQELLDNGVLAYLRQLKEEGVVRHLGFSSHTPAVANKLLDLGDMEMMLFSINPAYDFEQGDEYGIGSVQERFELFCRCQSEGVGITVMKPFFGGKLLSDQASPFGIALNQYQCLQYCIDRPGVLAAVPGITSMEELDQLLGFCDASKEEKDYSVIGSFTAKTVTGTCVYCSHCQPCPAGIQIALVNKYYDLARAGDAIAAGHYDKLSVHADSCLNCGHCDSRCPFSVKQSARMEEISAYFGK